MPPSKRKRGISLFRARDAVSLDETDFMIASKSSGEVPSEVRQKARAHLGAGRDVRLLVRDAGGFSLVHVWFKPGYQLPRHNHDVDCLYYVISGTALMGRQTLAAGDSFLVPAGAPYQYSAGPDGVEVLEIRHGVEQFDVNVLERGTAGWEAITATAVANAAAWERMPTSPTFAANPATD